MASFHNPFKCKLPNRGDLPYGEYVCDECHRLWTWSDEYRVWTSLVQTAPLLLTRPQPMDLE